MKHPPKSIRAYIRKEKARIRREIFDKKEQQEALNMLYNTFSKWYKKTSTGAN